MCGLLWSQIWTRSHLYHGRISHLTYELEDTSLTSNYCSDVSSAGQRLRREVWRGRELLLLIMALQFYVFSLKFHDSEWPWWLLVLRLLSWIVLLSPALPGQVKLRMLPCAPGKRHSSVGSAQAIRAICEADTDTWLTRQQSLSHVSCGREHFTQRQQVRSLRRESKSCLGQQMVLPGLLCKEQGGK